MESPDLTAASPDHEAAPAIPLPRTATHGGLLDLDPFAPVPRSVWTVLWPWGLSGLTETLEVLVLATVMFLGVRVIAHNYIVDGGSMQPTFENGELVIVNRLAYREIDLSWVGLGTHHPFGAPQAGDVVVFVYQEQPKERDFIKRVIALPGQTVEVAEGRVVVDGVALDEPYISAPPNYTFARMVVPEGQLFVLGDNRNNSYDSHLFGTVEQSKIIGRADLRYWPANRFWFVDHHLGTPATTVAVPARAG